MRQDQLERRSLMKDLVAGSTRYIYWRYIISFYLCHYLWEYYKLTYQQDSIVIVSYETAAAWLRHRTVYCAFLPERREPHGVPSVCGHSCMVYPTVCQTVMPSFSDTQYFSYWSQLATCYFRMSTTEPLCSPACRKRQLLKATIFGSWILEGLGS